MSELRLNQWLAVLVKLVAPMDQVKAAEGAVGMEPALAQLPANKLTEASAVYVATKSKRMPNYGTICELLDEWWEANKPKLSTLALAGPDDSWQAKHDKHLDQCREDWRDPQVVRRAVASLHGHPMKDQMGKLLGMAVAKFGHGNLGLVPPEWHPNSK